MTGGVSIRLCGAFTVTRYAGAAVAVGGRARLLLALLAAGRGRVVGQPELIAALWPDHPPRRPADNIATLVSRLRGTLGPAVVIGGRDGYRIGSPPDVCLDVDEAAALATEASRQLAVSDPALAAAAGHRGLDLLGTGELLVGEPDAGWLDTARAAVVVLLCTLRNASAEAALAAGDPDRAIGPAAAAVQDDPLDERAHRLLMTAHDACGERGRALATYERLRTVLADELGTDPAEATRALHLAILRGDRGIPRNERAVPRPGRTGPTRPSTQAPAGRDTEVATLTAAWSAVAAGRPGAAALLLAGEAGIGKTTLAAQAVALAERTGGLVLQARCYAAERSLFLQPVLDAVGPALRSMPADVLRRTAGAGAGVLATLLPDLAAALGGPVEHRGSAEMALRRGYDAVTGVIRALAADGPVLLLLDDLHNAGVATVELVHYLIRRSAGTRLLVLATVRNEEGAAVLDALAEVADRLDVGPLPPDAVALLAARAGAPRLAEDILRRTRGHALFVVETLRGLIAGETGVPASLQAAVLARLRRAGPDVERVLRAGAVLGASVAPVTVAALLDLPLPDAVRWCEQAAAARLLVATGETYEFANDLVQEVLYATTPAPTRAVHHRRATDLLTEQPESQAGHAAAVGDWPRAARSWLLAGERAFARFAAADARALLDQALDAASRVDDPALAGRIHLARALAHEALAAFGPALADLEAALAAARVGGERRLEMTVLRRLAGDLTSALGLPERGRQLDAGLRIAVELDDLAAQADLGGWQAVVAANRLRFTDAIALGRRAVAAGRAAGTEEALTVGLDGLKAAYAYLGDVGELAPVLAELEPLLRRRGDLRLLYWAVFESALPAVAAAEWDLADARIGEAMEINERTGASVHRSWLLAHRGWVARLRGRLDEAADLGRAAVEDAAASGHHWWRSSASSLLATTLLEQGGTAEAVTLLENTRESAVRSGAEGYLLRCLAPLAQASGSAALLRQANALLDGIRAPAGGAWLSGGDAYLSVATAWRRHGEPRRARAVLAPLLTAAERHGWVPWLAMGGLADAAALDDLGEHAEAARVRAGALAVAKRSGMGHLT